MGLRKKTKIVATLGPATSTKEVLKGMMEEAQMCSELTFRMPTMTM